MVTKIHGVLESIGVKKALPFTKFLNYELNKLRGSGVLQNILTVPKQSCPVNEHPTTPINFSKMVCLFTVFVLGGTFSILIFIIERAVSKKKDGTLEKNDGRAIARRALVHQDFTESEKRAEADIEIDSLLLATPPKFQSYLRHWMESNATKSMEEFLKLMKLEVGAILVNHLLSRQKK